MAEQFWKLGRDGKAEQVGLQALKLHNEQDHGGPLREGSLNRVRPPLLLTQSK